MMWRQIFSFILIFILIPGIGLAETTGKIAGMVVDQATQDPLPGVNITVEGTNLRAISGPRGEYFIVNVPIGTYDVEARMIGYLALRTSNIGVNAGLTTRVTFSLQTTVLDISEPLVITAPRPLIRPDLTASSEVITSDDIKPLPVTDISDLILLQNGVVRDAQGDLHVRGGRSNELTYYVDGAGLQDPLLGGLGSHINLDTIEELVINRGGFDAQYGDAMSGIVNIVTKEGAAGYSGRLRNTVSLQSEYNVSRGAYDNATANGRNLSGSFGGPLPRLGEKGNFFLSGQQRVTGNYLPHHREYLGTVTGNMVFRPYPLLKIKIGGHYATQKQKIYDHRDPQGLSYDFNLDGLPERRDRSYALNMSINHSVTSRTFYTARFYRYTTDSKLAPSLLFDPYWTQWPGYSEDESGRYVGSIYQNNQLHGEEFEGLHFTSGDDYLPQYRRAQTTYYGVRIDLSSQITYRNQLRVGVEGQWYRLAWDEKTFVQETPAGEQYTANPVEGAVYLQNKLELANLIVNGGIRIDYFDTGQRFFVNLPTGHAELRNSPTKVRLSPRVGISHPITSSSLFRVSYGYFYQPPEFRFAYENIQGNLDTEYPRIGNPSLDLQKTVAYEVGLEHLLTDNLRASATATYKMLSNLTSTTQVRYPGGVYSIFTNADFGTVRGLEFSLKRNMARSITGAIHYTYSVAEGSSSDPQENYNLLVNTPQIEGEEVPTNNIFPLAFDQRHTLTTVLTARTPSGWNKRLLGIPLNDWGMSLVGQYGSGLPYTPTSAIGERLHKVPNTARLPALFNLDLRLHKRFWLGSSAYTFFTEIENLFNRRNVINVYANTGSPDDDGYRAENFTGKSPEFERLRRLFSLDPQHYSPPREIRIGLEVAF